MRNDTHDTSHKKLTQQGHNMVQQSPENDTLSAITMFAGVAFLRVLIAYQPHSGQDNYHGSKVAYGGDFEAQRHWMELTWNLPVGEWYWYDLQYWGLDYPPLTAYQSWICGYFSNILVGPESIALVSSRGIEDPTHKAFMRATVLALDLSIYGSVAWVMARSKNHWLFLFAMIQPAIILIDHGHFQYNTTALGLAMWALYFISQPRFTSCMIGSIFFCLALCFKQMTLYYAPVVGCYLLGRCYSTQGRFVVTRFLYLAAVVLSTFTALWWPFIVSGPQDTTYLERLCHVIRRIFPIQRGLFEGKVANLWCALSIRPFSVRRRLSPEHQLSAALLLTIVLITPASIRSFQLGRENRPCQQCNLILWTAMSSALAFFLASFQVHEKSLLLALTPASLVLYNDPTVAYWFSIVTTWTLWPLLVMDRLQTAYFSSLGIFLSICELHNHRTGSQPPHNGFFSQHWLLGWIPSFTYTVMILLHVGEWVLPAPKALPDLFAVLWSVVGCLLCCLAYIISVWRMFNQGKEKDE